MNFPVPNLFPILALSLLLEFFWLWMLIDCLKHEADTPNKVCWVIVIVFLNALGAALYLFMRLLPRQSKNTSDLFPP